MKLRHEALPKIEAVLARHFGAASAAERQEYAEQIGSSSATALSLEWIERADLRPLDDIEKLKKAAQALRSAASEVRGIGWHGSNAALEVARQLRRTSLDLPYAPVVALEHVGEELASFLAGWAARLQSCAEGTDPKAGSVLAAFGIEKSPGRPKEAPVKTQAYFTTREAWDVFQALSGRRPTVSKGKQAAKTTGTFVAFVSDLFRVLDIEASAASMADKVRREKSRRHE